MNQSPPQLTKSIFLRLIHAICIEYGISPRQLVQRTKNRNISEARKVLVLILKEYLGVPWRPIYKRFRVSIFAAQRMRNSGRDLLDVDRTFNRRFFRILLQSRIPIKVKTEIGELFIQSATLIA